MVRVDYDEMHKTLAKLSTGQYNSKLHLMYITAK